MKALKRLVLAGSLLFAAGYALAQQLPSLFLPSPIGSETMNLVNNGPQIVSVRLAQVRDASGYTYNVPLTGFSLQVPNYQSALVLNPAGTLAAGTVTFPVLPVDGQRLIIFSTQTITALTLTPPSGQTITGAVTTLAANGSAEYIYILASATWIRLQ